MLKFLLHIVQSCLKICRPHETDHFHENDRSSQILRSSLWTKILETYTCTSDFVVRIACLGPKLAHVTWSRCEDVTTCGCSKTIVKK
ncbi:hypothetical protein B7P43_G01118 [Cryptotermes secundus]|uniref:Uncharacterized protein n=1 Tax=Cryptotermes secundus TaxID=105785 RepID=A0A2J7PIL7_9NEOP|nr:hypothetical protein B7P43_G01118 [Cryptotermes secundus]